MVVGASTEEPVIFAFAIFDRQVVDAGDPPSHQALFVELPILVAIAAKPVAGIVVPFICKAHGGERRKWRPIHFQLLYVRAKKDRDRSPPAIVTLQRALTGCRLNTRNLGPSSPGDI